MRKCPNCGQPSARTKDWACRWCGYPLISRAYKGMPQSYKELKEEKGHKEEQPVREQTGAPSLVVPSSLAPTHTLEPAPEPILEPELKSIPRPEPEAKIELEAELTPEVEPEPKIEPEAELTPEVEPEPKTELEAELTPEVEPEPKTEPEAELTPEVEPEPKTEPEATLTALEVSTEELYSAYKANEIEANAKYEGKVLKVTGVVDRIVVNDIFDIHYIILTSAEKREVWKVRCTFDKKHASELSQLTTEQAVTVQGKHNGYKRNILMEDCVLVR